MVCVGIDVAKDMLYSIEIPLYENPKSVSPKSAHRILSVSIAPRIV